MKIVITDHRFPDVAQEQRAVEAAGGTLVVGQAATEDEVADPAVASEILERLQKLSQPFGTSIAIRDGVGNIAIER